MPSIARRLESVFDQILFLLFATTIAGVGTAHARSANSALGDIEDRWASAVYETDGRAKDAALSSLLDEVREYAAGHSGNPDAAAWHGIIARECLQARCGSGSARLQREARDALLRAEELDPGMLGGRVYANLGALYSEAPTMLGGFGSKVKGIGYMWKAIVVDPDGFDSNYLYAELLVGEKRLAEAREILLKVSAADERPEHQRADRGRRQQALALLQEIETQLGQSS